MKNTVKRKGITVSVVVLQNANLRETVILEAMPELVVLRNQKMSALQALKAIYGLEKVLEELYNNIADNFACCECDDCEDCREMVEEILDDEAPYLKVQLDILKYRCLSPETKMVVSGSDYHKNQVRFCDTTDALNEKLNEEECCRVDLR